MAAVAPSGAEGFSPRALGFAACARYKSIEPWLKRKDTKKKGDTEYYQSREDRAKLDGALELRFVSTVGLSDLN